MSETAQVSDFFQLIDMKVLITEDTLDSLLSIKISSDGGKTYTDYSVSSLKNGTTFDCSPNDLKVICDANVLKYIQVLADGEKSTSNVDLSDYLKFKDIYVDVYKNPYYGVQQLPQVEVDKLSALNSFLYYRRIYEYYCSSENFMLYALRDTKLVSSTNDVPHYSSEFFYFSDGSESSNLFCLEKNCELFQLDDSYYVYITKSYPYLHSEVIQTNVRVHFIKHF